MGFQLLLAASFSRTLLVAALCVVAIAACDSANSSEDDELGHIELRLTPEDPSAETQVISIDALTPSPVVSDTLFLTNGETYTGSLEFLSAGGDRIVRFEEADQVQAFYEILGVEGVAVEVTDVESNYGTNTGEDFPVGFSFRISVDLLEQDRSGSMRFRFAEWTPGLKTGQLPAATLITHDASIPVQTVPLPRPPSIGLITRAIVTVSRINGSVLQTVDVSNPSGLSQGVPVDTVRIASPGGQTFRGEIRLFDADGAELTETLDANASFFRFDIGPFGSVVDRVELDGEDQPYGRTFEFSFDPGTSGFSFAGMRLLVFDPNLGGTKDLADGVELTSFDLVMIWSR